MVTNVNICNSHYSWISFLSIITSRHCVKESLTMMSVHFRDVWGTVGQLLGVCGVRKFYAAGGIFCRERKTWLPCCIPIRTSCAPT